MRLLLFLPILISTSLFAQGQNIEGQLDSLMEQYIQENQLSVTHDGLVGTYNRNISGYFNETLKMKDNGTYEIKSRGCFGGTSVAERGKWEVKGGLINFTEGKRKSLQVFAIEENGAIALLFPDSDILFKTLALDAYQFEGEDGLKDVVAKMEDLIESYLYKK